MIWYIFWRKLSASACGIRVQQPRIMMLVSDGSFTVYTMRSTRRLKSMNSSEHLIMSRSVGTTSVEPVCQRNRELRDLGKRRNLTRFINSSYYIRTKRTHMHAKCDLFPSLCGHCLMLLPSQAPGTTSGMFHNS